MAHGRGGAGINSRTSCAKQNRVFGFVVAPGATGVRREKADMGKAIRVRKSGGRGRAASAVKRTSGLFLSDS